MTEFEPQTGRNSVDPSQFFIHVSRNSVFILVSDTMAVVVDVVEVDSLVVMIFALLGFGHGDAINKSTAVTNVL